MSFRPQAPPFRPFVPRGSVRTEDSQPQESVATNRRHTVPMVRSTPYPMGDRPKQGRLSKLNARPQQYRPPPSAPSAPKAMRPSAAVEAVTVPTPSALASVPRSAMDDEEEALNGGGPSSKPAKKAPKPVPPPPTDEEKRATKKAKKARSAARKAARREAALASQAAMAADEEAVLRVVTPPSPSPAPDILSPSRSVSHAPDPLAGFQPMSAVVETEAGPSPPLPVKESTSRAASVPSGSVPSQPVRLVSLQPTPIVVDLPDIKPDIRLLRRSPTPPVAPAPSIQKTGVASWTEADLPAACNMRGAANQLARDKARRHFRLRQTWELANQCRLVTSFKWISGGLALDWRLEASHGTWTRLYPTEVRNAAPEVRRRFLDGEVASIEAKGWTVMLAEEKLADDGSVVGVSVAWLNDAPEPSLAPTRPPSARNPPRPASPAEVQSMSRPAPPRRSAEPVRVVVDLSLAPPPSALLAAAALPPVRVKPEPMDIDVAAMPLPTVRPLPLAKPSPEAPQLSIARPRNAAPSSPLPPTPPAQNEPKAEPKIDADPMGNPLLLVSQAVTVSQRLQSASNAHYDLEAIEAAQVEVRLLLGQAGAVLNRLEHMRAEAAERAIQGHHRPSEQSRS